MYWNLLIQIIEFLKHKISRARFLFRMVPSSSNFHGYQMQHQVAPTSSMPQLQVWKLLLLSKFRTSFKVAERVTLKNVSI